MKPPNIMINQSSMHNSEVHLTGYKHAMVQIISASISTNIPVSINNVPLVDDTFILSQIINECGGTCELKGHFLECDPREMRVSLIPQSLSQRIHGSLYLMPSYAVRFGGFKLGKTGGCQIGDSKQGKERPFSHMLRVMELFGIQSTIKNGFIKGNPFPGSSSQKVEIDIMNFSTSKDLLGGSHISGATKTAILLSPLAESVTLKNPYFKTDVRDLLRFFELIGAKIQKTHNKLCIASKLKDLSSSSGTFSLTECVSQVMTYIALAVHCNIEVRLYVHNVLSVKEGLKKEFKILDAMGILYRLDENSIYVFKTEKVNSVDIDVTNDTIQSDHLPFFALMLLRAEKPSILREFVWPQRFAYVQDLKKLGADLDLNGNTLTVRPSVLKGSNVVLEGHDTRSAAVIAIASLAVKGPVFIQNIFHLYRGYERFLELLIEMGAKITPLSNKILQNPLRLRSVS